MKLWMKCYIPNCYYRYLMKKLFKDSLEKEPGLQNLMFRSAKGMESFVEELLPLQDQIPQIVQANYQQTKKQRSNKNL